MGQRNGFGQFFVDAQAARQRARDLRHFQAVPSARAEQIAFMVDEDLRLVFQASERRAMDDAVAIALEFAAVLRRRFGMGAAQAARGIGGVGRQCPR